MSKSLYDCGDFVLLSEKEKLSGENVLNYISLFQEETGIYDTDRMLNEVRDSKAGRLAGFDYVNRSKNGFDCRNTRGELLEVKSVNCCASDWGATFNDTNEEKASAFTKENVYLQVPVWIDAKRMSFFLIGNNPEVGEFLLNDVKNYIKSNRKRCTQTLTITKLYNRYGFKIVSADESKEDVVKRLKAKHRDTFKNLTVDEIMSVDEYKEWKEHNCQ